MQPSIIISKDMVENADQIFLQKIKNVKKHTFCVEITKNDDKNICINFNDSHQYQECLGYFLEVLPRHSYNHKKNNKNHYRRILGKHIYLINISSKMRPFKDIIKSSRDYITQYFFHFKEK